MSFIFYSFHYTGKLNDFDWIIYWANVVAWLLQPALFLHFALTFPERKAVLTGRRWLIPAVYFPGALLLAVQIVAVWLAAAERAAALEPRPAADGLPGRILRDGDVCPVAQLPACGLGHPAAADEVGDPRHHSRGRAVHDFLRHSLPVAAACRRWAMKVSVLSLVFLPLTFGYAIFRYRLMDVDLIFKRGMAYTIAAGAILAAYFAAVGVARRSSTRASPAPDQSGW